MIETGASYVLRVLISIRGNVQGVGFRPFIHRLALQHKLSGSVANTPAGVEIIAEGTTEAVHRFCRAIPQNKPPHAVIDHLQRNDLPTPTAQEQIHSFQIITSAENGICSITPPADMDLCERCRDELLDPHNRRYHYPFINCTDCGPRYTLIRHLPFDRAKTAMASFTPCPLCAEEYNDPANRRFHTQAISCPVCGPRYFLADRNGQTRPESDPITTAIDFLRDGKIVAIKGVGGYHLAVDASNQTAVQLLRQRKNRPDKPLAIMAANIEAIKTFAHVGDAEAALLASRDKPIVLLAKKTSCLIPEELAPANNRIGVMLPYTPLHHLLLAEKDLQTLVMTSGNRSGEPICTDITEATNNLAGITDLFLHHDRDIIIGCDDSVQSCRGDHVLTLRNGRGLAPTALPLPMDCGHTLALGGNDKNSICLTRGNEGFISQHIGNLDHFETMQRFRQVTNHLRDLLEVEPDLLVHDLHPDYASSRFAAEQTKLPTMAVQHHHAHAVSCMAEHNLSGPVLALTLDGNGYGQDHTIWGGEILLARLDGYERLGFLSPTPMPGSEQATREPWRMAVSFLHQAYGDDFSSLLPEQLQKYRDKELPTLIAMIEKGINSPLTSSCGRLFDGVAAILGLCHHATFDGQGAMSLEAIADTAKTDSYPQVIHKNKTNALILDSAAVIREVITDMQKGTGREIIAARFHATMAALFSTACRQIRAENDLNQVVCSGGVFQNILFTTLLTKQLEAEGFTVYTHQQVPPNDGGLALGQAVAGRTMYQRKR